MSRKWKIFNNQLNKNYNVAKVIIYNTEVLKSNLYDYNDACILVRGDIAVTIVYATQLVFINCAPFTKCITKTDGRTIDNAEGLDLVMPMYYVFECSLTYSDTTGSLWFYFKDKATNVHNDIAITHAFKSFKYKFKL